MIAVLSKRSLTTSEGPPISEQFRRTQGRKVAFVISLAVIGAISHSMQYSAASPTALALTASSTQMMRCGHGHGARRRKIAFKVSGIGGCLLGILAAAVGKSLREVKDLITGFTRVDRLNAVREFEKIAAGVGVNFDLAGLLLTVAGWVADV